VTLVQSKMIKLCYLICKSIKPCRFLQNKNKILVVIELICPQIQIANKKMGINRSIKKLNNLLPDITLNHQNKLTSFHQM
jgi:hypothetical protein